MDGELRVETLLEQVKTEVKNGTDPEAIWSTMSQSVLRAYPFDVHLAIFTTLFPTWRDDPESAPAWLPTASVIEDANITAFMSHFDLTSVTACHQFSVKHYTDFWSHMLKTLGIVFKQPPTRLCDLSLGVAYPQWLVHAKFNIVDSCFLASPHATAIIYDDAQKQTCHLTYSELDALSNHIANSLVTHGYETGDAIAIAMPMNHYAVAIYLGIIKMGGVVVSIVDSFSTPEMATRLTIARAVLVFTQDVSHWGGRQLPLYEKLAATGINRIIMISSTDLSLPLRTHDLTWNDFLVDESEFESVACDPISPCTILFSSGTTADPKAVAWNHTTPIKAASDAYFHQNIQENDVLLWPTNLGWMMGPWLIFAALMNKATIALYPDVPKGREFGEFVERSGTTMLGVVPTLVANWHQTNCMNNLNWQAIKSFSSTGECSNAEDMLYLMSLAGYKPIIEYCGGTEIGGAYLSSTIVEKNYPSLFSTPAMGMNITIIDEAGHPANVGEVAIIPPSIGLSTELINANHYQIYYEDMPQTESGETLRRHGDLISRLPHGHYCILGRADDTMNLGGIKISSAEIERAISGIHGVIETAAIAVTPADKGPSQLVIYVSTTDTLDKETTLTDMQKRISSHLNPLFKIHDIVFTNELPKTASNKIMRRVLRKQYQPAE